jgi:hypothetical protein
MEKKYVYLIRSEEFGYYKIGVSKHPQKRILQLKTGNSSVLKLIESYPTEFANKIEGTLHRKYSHLHKEGEWFDLSIKEEISFINDCKKIETSIKFLKDNNNFFI